MQWFILLYCKVFNIIHMAISILFFTSLDSLFVFQLTVSNDI